MTLARNGLGKEDAMKKSGFDTTSQHPPYTYPCGGASKRVSAREDERRKIAHELHNAFGQDLVAVLLEMNRLASYCKTSTQHPRLGDEVCAVLESLSTRVGKIAASLGEVSHQLHPVILERVGLQHAIRQLCDSADASSQTRVQFRDQELSEGISFTTSLCLYRIAQEALHNVERHAHASYAEVGITEREDWIDLRVCDNGVGYDPRHLRPDAGLGIASMKDHVASLGGSFAVKTAPGRGTEITVRLPLRSRN
jgi:signal transduction histidine kinase